MEAAGLDQGAWANGRMTKPEPKGRGDAEIAAAEFLSHPLCEYSALSIARPPTSDITGVLLAPPELRRYPRIALAKSSSLPCEANSVT